MTHAKKLKADNLIKSLPNCVFGVFYLEGQGQVHQTAFLVADTQNCVRSA